MASNSDALMISTGSLFENMSASSMDREPISDADFTDTVMSSELNPDSKMTLLLKQAERVGRARSGSAPNTPR